LSISLRTFSSLPNKKFLISFFNPFH
jgi:hypothetical protein